MSNLGAACAIGPAFDHRWIGNQVSGMASNHRLHLTASGRDGVCSSRYTPGRARDNLFYRRQQARVELGDNSRNELSENPARFHMRPS